MQFANRHFAVGAGDDLVSAQRATLPGPSIISIEMPRCRQPLACMNHITSFGIEPARADQHRQAYTLAAAYHFRAARLLNMHGPASAGQLAG
jgi:hypothetical protein